jgi:hypothetical protein
MLKAQLMSSSNRPKRLNFIVVALLDPLQALTG